MLTILIVIILQSIHIPCDYVYILILYVNYLSIKQEKKLMMFRQKISWENR